MKSVELDIYEAKIVGLDFLTAKYTEPIGITWPCGATTKLNDNSLYDLGEAIAEHMLECNKCQQ